MDRDRVRELRLKKKISQTGLVFLYEDKKHFLWKKFDSPSHS